ncbi:hypothetical protein Tco_1559435, partial [Tanacetum coccineum]
DHLHHDQDDEGGPEVMEIVQEALEAVVVKAANVMIMKASNVMVVEAANWFVTGGIYVTRIGNGMMWIVGWSGEDCDRRVDIE